MGFLKKLTKAIKNNIDLEKEAKQFVTNAIKNSHNTEKNGAAGSLLSIAKGLIGGLQEAGTSTDSNKNAEYPETCTRSQNSRNSESVSAEGMTAYT